MVPQGKRRLKLQNAVTEIIEVNFSGSVLTLDSRAALMFGANAATIRQAYGQSALKDMNEMIAAIAISHDRCLPQRGTADPLN